MPDRLSLRLLPVAIFFMFVAAIDTLHASEGPANGGGGKSVVCPDSQHPIESVTLLDLWEGQEIRKQNPLTVSGGLEENVNRLLERAVPIVGGDVDPKVFRAALKRFAAPFLDPNSNRVLRFSQAGLNLTNDSFELIYPRTCKIEQVVNYQLGGSQILIDQKLFENMDLTNQAALILHEAVYGWLREFEGDMNSIRARRIVSYIMSHESPLMTPPAMEWEEGQVVCSGTTTDQRSSRPIKNTILVFSKDKKTIDFRSLNGEIPKGFSESARRPQQKWFDWFRKIYFSNAECTKSNFDFGLDGPIEYDTSFQLVKDCKNGKPVRRIGVRKPGEAEYHYTDVKCRLLKKGEWGNES